MKFCLKTNIEILLKFPATDFEFASPQNHESQFFKIIYIYGNILLVLFLWRTLTDTHTKMADHE
jgi:hypothetical protein